MSDAVVFEAGILVLYIKPMNEQFPFSSQEVGVSNESEKDMMEIKNHPYFELINGFKDYFEIEGDGIMITLRVQSEEAMNNLDPLWEQLADDLQFHSLGVIKNTDDPNYGWNKMFFGPTDQEKAPSVEVLYKL